jgi:outer membrane protein assembly factor BamE (lipoprotein component of BamABCDE complex)
MKWIIILSLLVLPCCAGKGTQISKGEWLGVPDIDKINTGSTTEAQVMKIFGEPSFIINNPPNPKVIFYEIYSTKKEFNIPGADMGHLSYYTKLSYVTPPICHIYIKFNNEGVVTYIGGSPSNSAFTIKEIKKRYDEGKISLAEAMKLEKQTMGEMVQVYNNIINMK